MRNDNFDIYVNEVLAQGADAILPRSLNDYWLNCLLEKAYLIKDENESVDDLKYVCGAVFLILQETRQCSKISVSDTELNTLIRQYCTEIQLEALNRYTEFTISPATLDNIFSNRSIEVSKKPEKR